MTISSTSSRLEYTGNGVTTAFSVTFQFLATTDLKVYQAGTLKTITTHYTVSGGNGSTGTVTFLSAPANAEEIIIVNDPPMTQTTDYVANDPFPAESHERALDKLTILIQRLKNQVDRALVLSDTTVAAADFTLPAPVANRGLKWNTAADAIENTTFDIDEYGANASASAAAALVSETNAATSETNAATSESNAAISASSANAAAGAVAHKFTFDSSTSMADPGAGDIRFNNATVGSVTSIAFSANTADTSNPDLSPYIATWADSTNTIKGYITFKKLNAPETFAVFSVGAMADNTAWLEATVTHVASNGTWSNADVMYVHFTRAGNKGVDGVGAGDFKADGSVPMTGNLVFEGATADTFETTFAITDPTADRTITVPDASGTMALTNDSTTAKAWVNFNGTGTVAIRAAYNVTSITDHNTGDYTVNFTTALPDANYVVVGTGNSNDSGAFAWIVDAPYNAAPTVSAVRIATSNSSALADLAYINVAVFR